MKGSALPWLIGGVAAAGIGLGAYFLLKGPTIPPPTGCTSDAECPAGYQCVNGVCVPVSSSCPGGTSPCSSTSDCPSGQVCEGGCCGTPIPSQLQVVTNNMISQDETVGSVGVPFTNLAYCDWSSLAYQPPGSSPVQATVVIRIVDASGTPVPDLTLIPVFENGTFASFEGEVVTNSDGEATLHIYFRTPYDNGNCPGPGDTLAAPATDILDIYLTSGTVFGSVVCTGTAYISGI